VNDWLIVGKCSECGGNVVTCHHVIMFETVLMWCDRCGACRNRDGDGLPTIEVFDKGMRHEPPAKEE
jgi:hypothetical protein